MKLFRNIIKLLYILGMLVTVSLFYFVLFRFLDEGEITLSHTLVGSARYFQNVSNDGWRSGNKEKVDNYMNDSYFDDEGEEDDIILDHLDISDKDENILDNDFVKNDKKIVPTGTKEKSSSIPQRPMKILDFNHRKCCPLNYSFENCEYSACEFTVDAAQADLILINGARLKMLPLPPRHPGQLWLLYTKEPPTFRRFRYLTRPEIRNQINWTRCIFHDSTFRGHYGALEGRSPPDRDYDKIYAQKRHQVAWFVSNCVSQSMRGEYVRRMGSEIEVHIFGDCGNMTCGRHGLRLGLYGSQDRCLEQVSMDYKFYLSFENSLCSDYVTEKFYKLFENVSVIPVVRGGANYMELAPTGTYVNAKNFKSPEELGRYLFKLSKNKNQYLQMLKLKDRYTNTFPKPPFPCELCKALHTRREVPSTYDDILKWMQGHCWEPTDL